MFEPSFYSLHLILKLTYHIDPLKVNKVLKVVTFLRIVSNNIIRLLELSVQFIVMAIFIDTLDKVGFESNKQMLYITFILMPSTDKVRYLQQQLTTDICEHLAAKSWLCHLKDKCFSCIYHSQFISIALFQKNQMNYVRFKVRLN